MSKRITRVQEWGNRTKKREAGAKILVIKKIKIKTGSCIQYSNVQSTGNKLLHFLSFISQVRCFWNLEHETLCKVKECCKSHLETWALVTSIAFTLVDFSFESHWIFNDAFWQWSTDKDTWMSNLYIQYSSKRQNNRKHNYSLNLVSVEAPTFCWLVGSLLLNPHKSDIYSPFPYVSANMGIYWAH